MAYVAILRVQRYNCSTTATTCNLSNAYKEGFPAEDIANNDNFLSLLYPFGMVTIGGFYKGDISLYSFTNIYSNDSPS